MFSDKYYLTRIPNPAGPSFNVKLVYSRSRPYTHSRMAWVLLPALLGARIRGRDARAYQRGMRIRGRGALGPLVGDPAAVCSRMPHRARRMRDKTPHSHKTRVPGGQDACYAYRDGITTTRVAWGKTLRCADDTPQPVVVRQIRGTTSGVCAPRLAPGTRVAYLFGTACWPCGQQPTTKRGEVEFMNTTEIKIPEAFGKDEEERASAFLDEVLCGLGTVRAATLVRRGLLIRQKAEKKGAQERVAKLEERLARARALAGVVGVGP